jgi:hypothetical protein
MVAKCLQNLANLVEFGGKEPYMEVVNPFILKNKERMVYYLDQLSVRFFTYYILLTNALKTCNFTFRILKKNPIRMTPGFEEIQLET